MEYRKKRNVNNPTALKEHYAFFENRLIFQLPKSLKVLQFSNSFSRSLGLAVVLLV